MENLNIIEGSFCSNVSKYLIGSIIGYVIGYLLSKYIILTCSKRKLFISLNKNAYYFNLDNMKSDLYFRHILYKYNQSLLNTSNEFFEYGPKKFFHIDTFEICYTDKNNGLHYCLCGSKNRSDKIYLTNTTNSYIILCLDTCIPMFLNSARILQETTNNVVVTIFSGHNDKNSPLSQIPKDIIKLILKHLYISHYIPKISNNSTTETMPGYYNKRLIIDQGFDLHLSFDI